MAIAIAAAACNQTAAPPTTPTPPATATAETFTGGIGISGAMSFSFVITAAGEVTATLSALAPDTTLTVGFALGTWNGTVCQVVLPNDRAAQGSVVVGATTGAGALCVRIYDVGFLVAPITFEILVVHP